MKMAKMKKIKPMKKQTSVTDLAQQHHFAAAQCYAGLRTMGHNPLVASAMLVQIGLSLTDAQTVMTEYGDLPVDEN